MLVISDLNEDIEYSIPISFIVTLATFSDVNKALKAKFDLEPCRSSVPDDGRSCVHDRLSLIPVILLLLAVLHGKIDADAFLEDKLHALLSDTVTEMYKLG